MLKKKRTFLTLGALLPGVAVCAVALTFHAPNTRAQVAAAAPHPQFDKDIAPVFTKYCVGCHSGAQPKGDIMLKFKDEDDARSRMATNDEFWDKVSTMLASNQMPPATVQNRPSAGERTLLVDWINNQVLTDNGKPDPGPLTFHRLNSREYANTVRDLLYLPTDYNAAADFPADERGGGFDNNSDTLTISPVLIEHYLEAAEKAGTEAMKPQVGVAKDPGRASTSAGTSRLNDPSKGFKVDYANPMAKVRVNVEAFAPRVFRRPVTNEEVDELMKYVSMAFTHDGLSDESLDRAMALVVRAALMSPDFLFRLEQDPKPDGSGKVYELSEYQLASRLSYFLWSTMPDDELFAQARAGTLRQNLDAQIARMLKDPKAISLTKDFMGQWLEIRGLGQTPNVDKGLLASMQGETEHFFNYIVANNRPITDLLDADYSFVDGNMARLYGIPGITGSDFQKVQLDPAKRFGLLTQAAILTVSSKPLGTGLRTSPVVRGKFILENIFNEKIPPPPPDVPPLAVDDGHQLTGTVRQILEQHIANPVCAGCHARMDPYGFAFENYSGIGQWRDKDGEFPIDASGEVKGIAYTTPAQFRQVLEARKDDFRHAVVRKVLSYALGRGIQGTDRPAIEQIVAQVKQQGDSFNSVIINVVKSFPFENARGSVAATASAKPGPASKTALQPVSLSVGGSSK